eukprot:8173379-Ditylum_brightwellii.AAC.2
MGWEAGVPSSKCIVEDMKIIHEYSILKRFQARGCVVPGCGTCKGRRDEGLRQVGQWGGHRERKSCGYRFIHPDAEA